MFQVYTQNICHGARGCLQVMGLENLGSLMTGNVGVIMSRTHLLTEAMHANIDCVCMYIIMGVARNILLIIIINININNDYGNVITS